MNRLALIILLIPFMACQRLPDEIEASRNSELAEIPVEYALLTPGDFRTRLAEAPIAYLPLGTLEWHGEHLPLGSDGLHYSLL